MSQADLPDLIKSGKIKEAQEILEPLKQIDCSQNLLWYAAKYNRKDLILMILNRCTKVNSTSGEETPLQVAYKHKNVDFMTELISHANQLKIKIDVPANIFKFAIENEKERLINLILDSGVDPNEVDEKGSNALHRAALKGYPLPLFKRILEKIKDVNAGNKIGWTALINAAALNRLHIVEVLMNHPRIDVNVQDKSGNTALYHAVSHPAIAKALMNHPGIDLNTVDNYGWTALMYAAWKNKLDIVKELMNHPGIDVNVQNRDKRTALMIAADNNHPDIVKELMNHQGINLNAVGGDGTTALMIAASNNQLDIAKALMNHPGIDVNLQDRDKRTALMIAASNNHSDIVKVLMNEDDIDVNLRDKSGNTALHWAVINNHSDIVSQLLSDKNINASLKNTGGQTPLSLAKSLKHTDIEKLLPKPSLFGNFFSKKRPTGESKNTSKFAVLKY